MSKIKMLCAAFVAILAFSAVAAAGASAHEWLTLSGAKLTKVEKANTDGLLLLEMIKISPFLGGGAVRFRCDGVFDGTVGLGAADSITLMTNLAGAEADNIKCEVVTSTNAFCKVGPTAMLKPINLPWKTELILSDSIIFDDITTTEGTKKVGYGVVCSGLEGRCEISLERSEFLQNEIVGARFKFNGEFIDECNIAEAGAVEGEGTMLGVLAN